MKTPTLEEVKEHFKNVDKFKSTLFGNVWTIDHSKEFTESEQGFYCYVKEEKDSNKEIYYKSDKKYAEIVSYKELNDKHVQSVINKFAHRSEVGFAKYGTTLERKDLNITEWLNHLQEELMDATLYIEKLKE